MYFDFKHLNDNYRHRLNAQDQFLEKFKAFDFTSLEGVDLSTPHNPLELIDQIESQVIEIIKELQNTLLEFSDKDIKKINKYSLVRLDRQSIQEFCNTPFDVFFTDRVRASSCFSEDGRNFFYINPYDFLTRDIKGVKKILAHEIGHMALSDEASIKRENNPTVRVSLEPVSQNISGALLRHEENTVDKIADYLYPEVYIGEYKSTYNKKNQDWWLRSRQAGKPINNLFLAFGQQIRSRHMNDTHPSMITREWRSQRRCRKIQNKKLWQKVQSEEGRLEIEKCNHDKYIIEEEQALENFRARFKEPEAASANGFPLTADENIESVKDRIDFCIQTSKALCQNLLDNDAIKDINRYSLFKINKDSIQGYIETDYSIMLSEDTYVMGIARNDYKNIFRFNFWKCKTMPLDQMLKIVCHETGHLVLSNSFSVGDIGLELYKASTVIGAGLSFGFGLNALLHGNEYNGFQFGTLASLSCLGLYYTAGASLSRHAENTCDKIADHLYPNYSLNIGFDDTPELESNETIKANKEFWKTVFTEKINGYLHSDSTHPSTLLRHWRSQRRCETIMKKHSEKLSSAETLQP